MNFTYENQGSNTYLVYEIGAGEELDTMSLGMLTNNSIPGFAATSFTQMDTTRYIKYNVSAKVSVSQLFTGIVNRKRLLGVFSGIVNAMLEAEEYMLEPSTILLDLDHIFADVSTCETVVICLPLMEAPFQNEDLGKMIKNIMFTTQFDHTENCDHVTQILNFLNSSPVFSLVEFKALLDQLTRGGAPIQAPRPAYQPAPQPMAAAPVQPAQPPVQPMQPPVQPMQPPVQPMQPPVQPMQPPVQPMQPPVQQPAPKAPQPAPKAPQPAQPPVGFAVPGKNTPQQPPMQVPKPAAAAPRMGQQPAAEDEEPITLMYLMQHYNKENAAKYKAQQEAKKNKGKEPAAAAPMPPQAAPGGFAVPGKGAPAPMPPQAAPGGFAVPGKPAPAPMPPQAAPGGFAVPGKPAPAPVQPPVPQPMPQQPAAPVYQQPVAPAYQQPAAPAYQQPAQPGRPLNFGETTVLGGGAMGETTVLGGGMPEQAKPQPYLVRSKNNEKIPLNKPVFRIGKEKSYVDYFIGDNTAISRSHANIVNHDGEYFVVDTNSTNHTYVNGGMINSNEEIKLSHGTKIRLANEDFEFKLY